MDTSISSDSSGQAPEPSRSNRRNPTESQIQPLVPKPEFVSSPVADDLVSRLTAYQTISRDNTVDGANLVRNAYAIAREAHEGQMRSSGEPYIDHPVAVAQLLLDLRLDATSIAAGLLHDVLEDTTVDTEQMAQFFGPDIARLVDGVTKLTALEDRTKEEAQVGTYRKMFIAMADDPRVVLVKLADRLHNMQTLKSLSLDRQRRIARETLEIYAPLAHRLGIWQIKWQLEDSAFAVLEPEKYREIAHQLSMRRAERERLVQSVRNKLRKALEADNIRAEISGRSKHIYSIHRKMERKNVNLDQIYDQLAVRVIVDTVGECYQVLGIVHSLWTPIPGEFDDYIATPKESMYQSLHTAVLSAEGRPCEIQIRTHQMHEVAEHGIAAHWRYKEGFGHSDTSFENKLAWLRNLIEWRREFTDTDGEFVDSFKSDVLKDQVYVFSPQGKIIDLPVGSTPVDFAYRIHTQVGNNCVGAKVNNRMVTLDYQLQSSDMVNIMTSKSPRGPSRDWLNFVKTSGARNHIRRYFKRLNRAENEAAGRNILEKELKRLGLVLPFDEIAAIAGQKSIDDVFAQIGSGDLSARNLAQKILAQRTTITEEIPLPYPNIQPENGNKNSSSAILVRGTDNVLTRLAKCCNPVEGDYIIGYTTRGKGITVHRADCRTIINEPHQERLVEVNWKVAQQKNCYPVPIRVEAWDRVGLWHDITGAIADASVNIIEVQQQPTRKPNRAVLAAILQIQSVAQLSMLLDKLNRLPDVIEAYREHTNPN
jgi:guanosine-3',5'-bis(diphosphate) 3'-pyrophosphohydrolase